MATSGIIDHMTVIYYLEGSRCSAAVWCQTPHGRKAAICDHSSITKNT